MSNLMQQATNIPNRYKKFKHDLVQIGDVVLLQEKLTKRINYPYALVTSVEENDLGEITAVIVKKGATGEKVRRHVNSIIPILSSEPGSTMTRGTTSDDVCETSSVAAKDLPSSTSIGLLEALPPRRANSAGHWQTEI